MVRSIPSSIRERVLPARERSACETPDGLDAVYVLFPPSHSGLARAAYPGFSLRYVLV